MPINRHLNCFFFELKNQAWGIAASVVEPSSSSSAYGPLTVARVAALVADVAIDSCVAAVQDVLWFCR